MIFAVRCSITDLSEVSPGIHVLSFRSPEISRTIQPGQFVNIKVEDGLDPMLRRPFSVYLTGGDEVKVIFHVVGKGTGAMIRKRIGDVLDVLGPLGVPFSVGAGDFETALLVGGGLGVAPLPITTAALREKGKRITTFLGARTSRQLVPAHLEAVHTSTDDGSSGRHGTVVELLQQYMETEHVPNPKIFGCGPTPMLRALASFARGSRISCEVSLEGPMGCGFGICQGCPVELEGEDRKYALMCKDGPVFDVTRIRI